MNTNSQKGVYLDTSILAHVNITNNPRKYASAQNTLRVRKKRTPQLTCISHHLRTCSLSTPCSPSIGMLEARSTYAFIGSPRRCNPQPISRGRWRARAWNRGGVQRSHEDERKKRHTYALGRRGEGGAKNIWISAAL